jgi:hypothetical protein
VLEKCPIGSFGDTNEARGGICYYRSLMNKKQNICFIFDPKTLLCSSCSGKEPHPVGGEGEGGERQVFVLSDQNERLMAISRGGGDLPLREYPCCLEDALTARLSVQSSNWGTG